jgi:hypothetical protein
VSGPASSVRSPPEIRRGLAWLHTADPVLARLIDERPGFDPDAWLRGRPPMDLFGALVFAVCPSSPTRR